MTAKKYPHLQPSALFLAFAALAAGPAKSADATPASAGATTVRPPSALQIAGSALGSQLEIEVLEMPKPAAEKALYAAWDAVKRAERELAGLAAAAQRGKTPLPQDLFDLVARASAYCAWSDGATGPAGGSLYRLWQESAQRGALPTPSQLEEAAATAKCSRLTLQPESREIALLPGSELDLRGFTFGWAVDLAVRSLIEAGATNARVELGPVTRGVGGGPVGNGWAVALPTLSASGNPNSQILLLDQAIAVADPSFSSFAVAGERIPTVFDLRSGKPATGVSLVAAVTALAADAEPLALAMSVLGANGGQLRLGSLHPKPSVLWLLGSGASAVIASSNWSAVRKP